jgi:putative ABC transport system permease protein
LGKQVDLQWTQVRRLEVVGVVGDVRLSRLEEEPEAALYVPFTQRAGNVMSVALETRMPPGSLAAPLREVLRKLDPDVPLADIATVSELVQRSMADRRVLTLAMTLLALFPLFLAAVGLFATVTYHVSRRRHEIGVRMALGADAGRIGGMVLGQGMALVGVGSALGVAGALAATRILRSQLFGVGAIDPLSLVSAVSFVVVVALAASATPTWRAIRSDPRVALQAE